MVDAEHGWPGEDSLKPFSSTARTWRFINYTDEYYNDESDQQGIAEVNVAKHRNGPTDGIKLSFLKRYAKFSDLAAA